MLWGWCGTGSSSCGFAKVTSGFSLDKKYPSWTLWQLKGQLWCFMSTLWNICLFSYTLSFWYGWIFLRLLFWRAEDWGVAVMWCLCQSLRIASLGVYGACCWSAIHAEKQTVMTLLGNICWGHGAHTPTWSLSSAKVFTLHVFTVLGHYVFYIWLFARENTWKMCL